MEKVCLEDICKVTVYFSHLDCFSTAFVFHLDQSARRSRNGLRQVHTLEKTNLDGYVTGLRVIGYYTRFQKMSWRTDE